MSHLRVSDGSLTSDSKFIRSVYAHLSAVGVAGDGVLPGVEQTRERKRQASIGLAIEDQLGYLNDPNRAIPDLDRYGFFISGTNSPVSFSSSERVNQDSSVLLQWRSYSPSLSKTSSQISIASSSRKFRKSSIAAEMDLLPKWEKVLVQHSPGSWLPRKSHASKKVTKLTWRGIPDRWRSSAWQAILVVTSSLPSAPESLENEFNYLMDQSSEYDVQIDLDVPRTMGDHTLFKTRYGAGQRSLFAVLHCLAVQNPEVGYCQGMGSIVAVLLCYYTDRQAFRIMRALNKDRFGEMFPPGFAGLLRCIYIQEKLVAKLMPSLHQALIKHQVSSTSYVTKWYITLFHGVLPFATQLRIFDLFFLLGADILILTSVAVLWSLRYKLVSAQTTLETLLSTLTANFTVDDDEKMFDWIHTTSLRVDVQILMKTAQADWDAFCASGTEKDQLI